MTAMPYMPKYLNIKKENKTMTDYPNNISTKLEILRHFGIQLVCKLTEGHTLHLKSAVVQILLDI